MSSINRSIAALVQGTQNADGRHIIKENLVEQQNDNKTYNYTGVLKVNTGEKRIYMTRAAALGDFDMFVTVAPVGADLTISIKKNGSSIATGTITDGAYSSTENSVSTSNAAFVSGDYYTIDITQVGSTTAGENLYVNLRITG